MTQQNIQQNKNRFTNWIRNSITARMLMVGFLIIILLIPLAFIKDLIRERSQRQNEMVSEINQQWGKEVLLYGPILKVPYSVFTNKTISDANTKQVYTETVESTQYAYFFPETLDINTQVSPETKKRGIYTTAVYSSETALKGSFKKPNFDDRVIKDEHIHWDKVKVLIKTSNLKGVNKADLELNGNKVKLTSNYLGNNNQYSPYIQLHLLQSKSLDKSLMTFTAPLNFEFILETKGSKQIHYIPVGKTTTARITSDWKDANFFGEFLPFNDDKITAEGFDATWNILDINRPFAQEHFNNLPDFREFAFGVNFMIPVDQYQQSERSVKYGFLVIALTFLVFFLIQTLSKIGIHPFQYLMIGLALTMFYTLLISISEHSSFNKAYLIAGTAVLALITLYSKSILKTWKFPVFIAISLAALYSFIYVIIQLENYALLVGSIGLFLILASVMYVSRKIDWSNG